MGVYILNSKVPTNFHFSCQGLGSLNMGNDIELDEPMILKAIVLAAILFNELLFCFWFALEPRNPTNCSLRFVEVL